MRSAVNSHEQRTIVSVDMRRMNRILWIDQENMMACIQAGAVGRHIMAELKKYGVTMGHEPDSVEFSTLGGWIATNASGMKKNRYGNIEDLVLDVSVATAGGKLERTSASPRESVGAGSAATDVRFGRNARHYHFGDRRRSFHCPKSRNTDPSFSRRSKTASSSCTN